MTLRSLPLWNYCSCQPFDGLVNGPWLYAVKTLLSFGVVLKEKHSCWYMCSKEEIGIPGLHELNSLSVCHHESLCSKNWRSTKALIAPPPKNSSWGISEMSTMMWYSILSRSSIQVLTKTERPPASAIENCVSKQEEFLLQRAPKAASTFWPGERLLLLLRQASRCNQGTETSAMLLSVGVRASRTPEAQVQQTLKSDGGTGKTLHFGECF